MVFYYILGQSFIFYNNTFNQLSRLLSTKDTVNVLFFKMTSSVCVSG
jgi:hypothetical protein